MSSTLLLCLCLCSGRGKTRKIQHSISIFYVHGHEFLPFKSKILLWPFFLSIFVSLTMILKYNLFGLKICHDNVKTYVYQMPEPNLNIYKCVQNSFRNTVRTHTQFCCSACKQGILQIAAM